MENLIDSLSKYNSASLLLLFLGVTILFLAKEYFGYLIKLRKINTEILLNTKTEIIQDEQPVPEQGTVVVDKSKDVIELNYNLLQKYYEQHLTEYRLMSRATLIISIFGFIIIVIGIFMAFANKTSVGVLTSIAGTVAEAASILFYKQNKIYMDQAMEYHKKLISTQYIHTAISLTEKLPDSVKVEEIRRICKNLLFLSNELHHAKSDHLFI